MDNVDAKLMAFAESLDADITGNAIYFDFDRPSLERLASIAADWASRQAEFDPQWQAAPKAAIFALTEGIVIGAIAWMNAEKLP